jgi:lysyl-tRNA synthetase class 2
MSPLNELERIRSGKADRLRQAGIDPYPLRSGRTHTTTEAVRAFEAASPEDVVEATVVGRIRSIRRMGKAIFAHVEDGAGRLQLFLRADELGPERIAIFGSLFDLGDFVQARGVLFRTRAGEVTLRVEAFTMLAKAITPLPAAKVEVVEGKQIVHSPFVNPEARYRERYADLAVNPEVREVFRKRTAVMRALQRFLDGRGFLEVETPILQPMYGGAAAQPFITHHNQLHQDLYLRISFELYLKRLLVGGIERVYEIGRDFRNEGISYKNNPEFTMLEFYMAYADYRDVMALTEEMVAAAAVEVNGSTKVAYEGKEVELAPPWARLDLRAVIREKSGIDIAAHPTAEALRDVMVTKGHEPAPGTPRGKLVESLLAHYVEPTLLQPTFVCDYPRDISPLAKSKPDDPSTVERFEAYLLGMEICNAFTELNDPADQEARFLELRRLYQAGDEERHPLDEDYLRAMRYGMPPCGGFGMGVDRLTMILTGQSTIREVILFPLLRERD